MSLVVSISRIRFSIAANDEAAAAVHHKRVFCAAGTEKCCTAAEQMEIASLAIKPVVVVDMMDGSEVAHRTSNVCGLSTTDTIDRVISDGASEIGTHTRSMW